MPKETTIRREKKKGLSIADLVTKYEAGPQPIEKMIDVMLSTPNPNAPAKINKRP